MKDLLRYPLLYSVAGLAAAWLLDSVRREFWWGVAVLGGLVSLYGFMAKQYAATPAEKRDVGDNCYFIGFVYTLGIIALSVGLDVSAPEAESAGAANPLLQTIGIALATSVIGMLWRFGLQDPNISKTQLDEQAERAALAVNKLAAAAEQFESAARRTADTADEVEKSFGKVRESAEMYSEKMRDESENIGTHLTEVAGKMLDDFGKRVADSLQKTQFDEVREHLQKAAEAHRKAVEVSGNMLAKSAASLDGAASSAVGAAEKVDGALERLHNSIAQMSQTTAETVETAMSKMQKSTDGYFRAAADAVDNALRNLKDAAGEDSWRAIAEAAEQFSALAKNMRDGLRGIAEDQRAFVENAAADAARLRELRDSFDSLVQDLQNDAATAKEIKENYRRQFEAAAKAALEETHQLYAKLIKGAEIGIAAMESPRKLVRELGDIAKRLEDISARLRANK